MLKKLNEMKREREEKQAVVSQLLKRERGLSGKRFCKSVLLFICAFYYLTFPLFLMQFVKSISNLKPIQVVGDGTASIELDLDLIEPSSRLFLYKVRLNQSHYRPDIGHRTQCFQGADWQREPRTFGPD